MGDCNVSISYPPRTSLTPFEYPDYRSLRIKLGASFFLFGLINNGESFYSVNPLKSQRTPQSSTLRDHPIRCAGPRSTIYAQGDHRVLQHIPCSYRQIGMAIPPQRADTLRKAYYRMHDNQRWGNVGAFTLSVGCLWIHSLSHSHRSLHSLIPCI